MLHRTVKQFLTDVYFGDLDVLLLDLPPGTGDVAISVGQLLPHAEVVVVTTPQAAASDVAERSGARRAADRPDASSASSRTWRGWSSRTARVLDLFGTGGGDRVAAALSAEGATGAAARLDSAQHVAAGGRGCRHPGRDRPSRGSGRRARSPRWRPSSPRSLGASPADPCRCVRGEAACARPRWLRCRTAGSRPGVKVLRSPTARSTRSRLPWPPPQRCAPAAPARRRGGPPG